LVRKIELSGQALLDLRLVRVSPGIVLGTSYRAWPLADAAGWTEAASGGCAGRWRRSVRLARWRFPSRPSRPRQTAPPRKS